MKSLDGKKNTLLPENLRKDLDQFCLRVRREILVQLELDSQMKIEITFGMYETNWEVSLLDSNTST